MEWKKVLVIATGVVMMGWLASCKKDKPSCDGSNPTYTSYVKSVIDSKCATSGCHGVGSGDGDFTTFSGLQPYLNNGSFAKEVLDKQTMPQNGSLSTEQLNKLQCWKENGYPQN